MTNDENSPMYELEFPAPELMAADGRGPVLVHGMEGFSDAGHAIRIATTHLREQLETDLVASFDIDDLLDYRSRRPAMSFEGDHFATYAEPSLNLYAMKDTAGTPFLLLAGMEPDLRWERFITAVRLLSERFGVRRTIGINAIPMAVPHTRPSGVTAHGSSTDLVRGYEPWVGNVQIPASAASLLELRLGEAGHEAMGFAVHVPHYLTQTDYPEAAQTLLSHLSDASELKLPLDQLTEAAARVREQIDTQVTGSEEVTAVVQALEKQYDAYVGSQERTSLLAANGELPTGDELGAELERFLAQRSGGESATGSGAPEGL
ncbi:MAG: PAC2 family protein [Actinomycetota bacterium]|jgi:predicted ATP-grasp superfamily ATP-dependent carboligase|nr:PAC2 family protein [Actinomycetota bacterium]